MSGHQYSPALGITSRLRKRSFDYSTEGAYFITCVTRKRVRLFGQVQASIMRLSPLGLMVDEEWLALETAFPTITLIDHHTMPDHFHGVLYIGGDDETRPNLSRVIGRFKSLVAKRYWSLRDARACDNIGTTCWQDKFHDSILWNDRHVDDTVRYIQLNPHRWTQRFGEGIAR